MRTDDGSEGCDWTTEDEALAESAQETRKHAERVRATYYCTAWDGSVQCSEVAVEGHVCVKHRRVA